MTASTMLKSRFWVFQPTVLNARVTALVSSPEAPSVSTRASMPDVEAASTASGKLSNPRRVLL